MSYCPTCGNPVSDASARFCMKCGRELPAAGPAPAAPPPVPPAAPTPTQAGPVSPPPPPPPTYAAPTATYPGAGGPPPGVPVPPSPAALFVRRVFSGGWGPAVLAAVVPAVVLFVIAAGLGTWSQHSLKNDDVSWQTRTRISLALTVQGLGGHASVPNPDGDRCSSGDDSDSDSGFGFSDGGDDGDDYGDDGGYGDDDYYGDSSGDDGDDYYGDDSGDDGSDYYGDDSDGSTFGSYRTAGYRTDSSTRHYSGYLAADGCFASDREVAHLSVVPLGVTLVWLLALILSLRSVRLRSPGPETAVRVALLTGAVSTALAFYAQPSLNGVELHSGPWRVLLWSFLLSLVTAMVVLNGPALRTRFGAVYRVLSTALIALAAVVLFAGVVVYAIGVGYHDELETPGLIGAALLLPNLGLFGLGLGWGAPFKITASGGGRSHSISFGLSRLNDYWDGSATPLAVLGGVLCALAIGLIAARRVRDRAQQFAVAGAFTLMFWVLIVIGGLGMSGLYGFFSAGSGIHEHIGTDAGQALLFALLWSFGGVLVAPFLQRVFGRGDGPGAYAGPSPYAPPPPIGGGQAYGQPQGGAYLPTQPGPAPAPAPAPAAPAPQPPAPTQEVHDLGVVQPDRLTKREATQREQPARPETPQPPETPEGTPPQA